MRGLLVRLGDLLATVLLSTRLSPLLTMTVGDVRLRFYPAAMCRYLWKDRHRYDQDVLFIRRFLRPGDLVVDAGANIGLMAVTAARLVGPRGRVVAIEAHPRTSAYLRHHVALNGLTNVDVHNVALGDGAGSVHLAEHPGDDAQNHIATGDGRGVEVPMVPLDRLLPPDRPVALLKVDVEGYEKFVLSGASRALRETACVYFESWDRHFARYHYTDRDLFRWLRSRGFRLYRLEMPQTLVPLAQDHRSPQCENLIATRREEELLRRTGCRLAAAS